MPAKLKFAFIEQTVIYYSYRLGSHLKTTQLLNVKLCRVLYKQYKLLHSKGKLALGQRVKKKGYLFRY